MLKQLLDIGSWGFILVIASILGAVGGARIDDQFGTDPTFMLGLLFLGIFMTGVRLSMIVRSIIEEQKYRKEQLFR